MFGLRAIGQGSGGVERVVEELSTRLAARGHEVTVFCRARYNPGQPSWFRGVRLVNLPAVYTKHLEAISHSLIAACCCVRGYDIVHVHAIGPSLVSWIPRLFGRQVVATVHAQDWRREKWGWFARVMLKAGAWAAVTFPQETIVVSRAIARDYGGRGSRRVRYIPNGVPEVTTRPIRQLARWGVRGQDYLLFLGRLVPEKGCHLLIEAFRRVQTDARLLIVGETSHTDAYVHTLRQSASGDARVIFTGALYGEEKDEAYSNARCLVFPSTLEGMPLVLLEAVSYGCPVVCSDIEENLDVFAEPDGEGGGRSAAACASWFASASVEELALRIEEVLRGPEEALARARRAREFVRETYRWDRIVDAVDAVYASLLPEEGRT